MRRRYELPRLLTVPAVCISLAACSSPGLERSFDAHDPRGRTLAAIDARGSGDEGAVEELVEMLGSEDAVARMLAVDALRRLTGRSFGYVYWADDVDRRAGQMAWERFVAGRGPTGAIGPMEGGR